MLGIFIIISIILFFKKGKVRDPNEKEQQKSLKTLAYLDAEIASRQKQLSRLDIQIKDWTKELTTLEVKVESWQLNEAEAKVRKVEIDNELVAAQNRLQEMLAAAIAERERQIEELKALQSAKEKLEAEIKLLDMSLKEDQEKLKLGKLRVEEVTGRLEELVAVEKNMRLKKAREAFEGGAKLEFEDEERVEIAELRVVLGKLRNAAPLAKAIYEIYYRDKMKRLVMGLGIDGVSGIYRI